MKIREYLSRKYKVKLPNAILAIEAKALGVEFPLRPGWFLRNAEREIDYSMQALLEAALTKSLLRCRSGTRAESINAGLRVLRSQSIPIDSTDFVEPVKNRPLRTKQKEKLAKSEKVRTSYGKVYVAGIPVESTEFLSTYEWRRLRMMAITKYGPRCQCCGASPDTGAVIHVDHIKPRRLFPHLALDIDNLQVLCEACNHGKSNWDQTDWRPKENAEAIAILRDIAKHG